MDYMKLDGLFHAALEEDVGTGDITTICCVPGSSRSKGVFLARERGVLCGVFVTARIFEIIDKDLVFKAMVKDGEQLEAGDIIATVEGSTHGILKGERVALNFMQRLSGISTATAKAASAVAGTKVKITDTRKCTPGLRALEKYAVRMGGGTNHRFGLDDGILIKDNHITAAGGIQAAVKAVRNNAPKMKKIEVETETLDQVRQAVDAGADIIMLDNMSCEQMKEAVALIDGRALTEASGNMGKRDLLEVANTGVDIISIGALTHSVKSLDISLKLEPIGQ